MAFNVKYKKLFEVELRQNYCLNKGAEEFAALSVDEQQERLEAYRKTYNLLDDFTLSVTEETRRALAGLGMLCKTTATGFFVATEVEEALPAGRFRPKRVPPMPLRLRFVLRLREPAFMNYTNLSLSGQKRTIYYFSNLRTPDGGRRTFPFLALDPPAYQTGAAYKAGDLVRRQTNVRAITLALRDGTHPRPPANTTGSLVWKLLVGRGYVNSNDRVSLYPLVFKFAFPSAVQILAARFVLVDPDGQQHEAGEAVAAGSDPLQTVQLDLRSQKPGRYRLEVVDQATDTVVYTEEVYLDAVLPAQRVFGLIEILHQADNLPYNLLDGINRLRLSEPESAYVIPFLNRYTYWRYRFASPPDHVPNATDFDEIDALQYVTKSSLPLTKSFIELEDDEGKPLPNPTAGLVKPEEDRVFSEVYMLHN